MSISGHVLYSLRNATIRNWPFPHFYVDKVFPDDFYRTLVEKLRVKRDFEQGLRHYSGRKFSSIDDFPELLFMTTPEFLSSVAGIFSSQIKRHFSEKHPGESQCNLDMDIRLVRDPQGYSIGPHTDARWKLISLLFYMPIDGMHCQCGTSLYLPKDRSFVCDGGPHHSFDNFEKIYTAPYYPNTCFGFFKTNNSFHGVEPLADQFNRDVLLYNIYDHGLYSKLPKAQQRGEDYGKSD